MAGHGVQGTTHISIYLHARCFFYPAITNLLEKKSTILPHKSVFLKFAPLSFKCIVVFLIFCCIILVRLAYAELILET